MISKFDVFSFVDFKKLHGHIYFLTLYWHRFGVNYTKVISKRHNFTFDCVELDVVSLENFLHLLLLHVLSHDLQEGCLGVELLLALCDQEVVGVANLQLIVLVAVEYLVGHLDVHALDGNGA